VRRVKPEMSAKIADPLERLDRISPWTNARKRS
jgi:hypothetical protein